MYKFNVYYVRVINGVVHSQNALSLPVSLSIYLGLPPPPPPPKTLSDADSDVSITKSFRSRVMSRIRNFIGREHTFASPLRGLSEGG